MPCEYLKRAITSIWSDYGNIKNEVAFKIAHEKLVRMSYIEVGVRKIR